MHISPTKFAWSSWPRRRPLSNIPVTVAVRGEVKRDSQVGNVTKAPLAVGSACVTMRSRPDIPWVNGDVLNERTVRTPSKPWQDTPDFDKIVAISLVPGHTYLVDLVAGCKLAGGSGTFETISSRSSCSAEADPVFAFDQAAVDKRLGASSFSLAILEQPVTEKLLAHLGRQAHAPARAHARGEALQVA